MICLDTNVVIGFLNGNPPALVGRLTDELMQGSTLALSVVSLFELHYGVAKSSRRAENRDRLVLFRQLPIAVLAFDEQDAEEAGKVRASLTAAGSPIGPYDVLIAAQARRRNATLATANVREFSRVDGLSVVDWLAAEP